MADIRPDYRHVLDYAFYPRSVAVIGASDQSTSLGYHFLHHLLDYGYNGVIYPVHPTKQNILNLKAYPNLGTVPGDVDLVICCVPTGKVLALLEECPAKHVKVMHLFTARLGETGRPDAAELERQIALRAKKLGITVIGPNCMGIYCPESGLAFGYGFPKEAGDIGVVFQSGGSASLLIQNGALQGLRFSKVVSYGNAMDIDESDLLDYLVLDSGSNVIAMYVEGVRDGRKFLNSLKRAAAQKPVIIIKGGKGKSGCRSVSSHTAAIAGSQNIWITAMRQSGAVEVSSLEEMIDLLVLFTRLPKITGSRICVLGGGGGKGIMAADLAEEAGLTLPALSPAFRNQLKYLVPDIWDWLGNPIDFSIWGDSAAKLGEIPGLFANSPDFDVLIIHCSDDNYTDDEWWTGIIKMEAENMINLSSGGRKPVIAVLSGGKPGWRNMENIRWKTLSEQRARLVEAKVPIYDTVSDAVIALSKFIDYWKRQ